MPHAQPHRPFERSARQRHDEVETFLNRFAAALTVGDGVGVAKLWGVPAFAVGADMATPLTDLKQIESFFGGAREQYNARGITGTRPEVLDEDWVDDRMVLVTVRWPYLDEQGREIGAEASTYTLCRDERGELKLRVATMRGVEGTGSTKPS